MGNGMPEFWDVQAPPVDRNNPCIVPAKTVPAGLTANFNTSTPDIPMLD
jgi:hypothetical protein